MHISVRHCRDMSVGVSDRQLASLMESMEPQTSLALGFREGAMAVLLFACMSGEGMSPPLPVCGVVHQPLLPD